MQLNVFKAHFEQARKTYPHMQREIGKVHIQVSKTMQERVEILKDLLQGG